MMQKKQTDDALTQLNMWMSQARIGNPMETQSETLFRVSDWVSIMGFRARHQCP